jgi:hypothetical protein
MRHSLIIVLASVIAVACHRPDPLDDSAITLPSQPPAPPNWRYHGDQRRIAQRSSVLPTLTLPGRHAFLVLANAEGFTRDGIGIANALSPHARAFRVLLADPRAVAAFRELATAPELPPRLYGLSGLYLLAPIDYRRYAERLRHSRETVTTQGGCTISDVLVSDVIGTGDPTHWEIESGVWPKALAGRPF